MITLQPAWDVDLLPVILGFVEVAAAISEKSSNGGANWNDRSWSHLLSQHKWEPFQTYFRMSAKRFP